MSTTTHTVTNPDLALREAFERASPEQQSKMEQVLQHFDTPLSTDTTYVVLNNPPAELGDFVCKPYPNSYGMVQLSKNWYLVQFDNKAVKFSKTQKRPYGFSYSKWVTSKGSKFSFTGAVGAVADVFDLPARFDDLMASQAEAAAAQATQTQDAPIAQAQSTQAESTQATQYVEATQGEVHAQIERDAALAAETQAQAQAEVDAIAAQIEADAVVAATLVVQIQAAEAARVAQIQADAAKAKAMADEYEEDDDDDDEDEEDEDLYVPPQPKRKRVG